MKILYLLLTFILFINLISFGQTTEDYLERGAAKVKLGDHKGAIEDYNKAIKINQYLCSYGTNIILIYKELLSVRIVNCWSIV